MLKQAERQATDQGADIAAEPAGGQRDEAVQRQTVAEREEGEGELSCREARYRTERSGEE